MIPDIPSAIDQLEFVTYPSFTYRLSVWIDPEPKTFLDAELRKWGDIKDWTWNEIKSKTWGQLRISLKMTVGTTINGDIDGEDALKQAIFHRLMTERYAYAIYDDNYGAELEQYIGRGFGFLEATIENTLRDALLQDDRITGVKVTNTERIRNAEQREANAALVEFDVFSNMGIINITGVLNV